MRQNLQVEKQHHRKRTQILTCVFIFQSVSHHHHHHRIVTSMHMMKKGNAKANDNRNDDANVDAIVVAVAVYARVSHNDHKI